MRCWRCRPTYNWRSASPKRRLRRSLPGWGLSKGWGGGPLEAELHRLKGQALLAGAGTVSEAESAIQRSIEVARRQNALSWELRAATSLAQLWHQNGRTDKAEKLLSSVFNRFSEGFETADLMTARTLIDNFRNSLSGDRGRCVEFGVFPSKSRLSPFALLAAARRDAVLSVRTTARHDDNQTGAPTKPEPTVDSPKFLKLNSRSVIRPHRF